MRKRILSLISVLLVISILTVGLSTKSYAYQYHHITNITTNSADFDVHKINDAIYKYELKLSDPGHTKIDTYTSTTLPITVPLAPSQYYHSYEFNGYTWGLLDVYEDVSYYLSSYTSIIGTEVKCLIRLDDLDRDYWGTFEYPEIIHTDTAIRLFLSLHNKKDLWDLSALPSTVDIHVKRSIPSDIQVFSELGTVRSAAPIYTATVNASGNGCTVTAVNQDGQSSPFYAGDVVTLTANVASGYDSSTLQWTGATPVGDPTTSNTATMVIPTPLNENMTFIPTATFNKIMYQGWLTEYADGEILGSSEFEIEHGNPVSVTVAPRSGYRIYTWSLDGCTLPDGTSYNDDRTSFTTPVMNQSAFVECFWTKEYMITSEVDGFGSVSPTSIAMIKYDTAELVASNTEHGSFSHWTKDGEYIGQGTLTANGSTLSISNPDAHAHYQAVFTPNTYNVSVNVLSGSETGSAKATPGSGIFTDTCDLEATANPGYVFQNWELDGVDLGVSNPMTVDFTSDAEYDAIFAMKPQQHITAGIYYINGTGDGNTTGLTLDATTGLESPVGSSDFTLDSEMVLTATSGPSYAFVEWRLYDENGPIVANIPTIDIRVDSSDAHYVAIFEEAWFDISAVPNFTSRGSVAVSDSPILKSEDVTISARPATGCFFKKFIDANTGVTLGTSDILTLRPSADMDIMAIFDTNPANIDPYAPGPSPTPDSDPDPIPLVDEDNGDEDDGDQGLDNEDNGDQDLDEGDVNIEDDENSQEITDGDDPVSDDDLPAGSPSDQNDDTSGQDDSFDSNELEEVANTGNDDEDVLDGSLPQDTPAMPQTAGIPMGMMYLAGSSLAGIGLKIRKKK